MIGDQRIRFTSGDYRGHATFWKQKLSLVERASTLGAHSIASTGIDAFKTASFALDAETTQMIDALTHGQALGRFVLGLAALFQTISRFTDSSIVAIQTPLYRAPDQSERFADVVNLIEEVREEQSLKEFASTLKQTVAKSFQYQNYPLEALFEPQELEPKTRNAILVFSPDLHDAPGDLTRYDLAIGFVANNEAISLAIHYNERLLEDATIDSFATACCEALRAFKRPDALLKRVDLMGRDWRERLLEAPNRTQIAYPAERLIHELFEEQARKTPERIAVRFEDRRMTYAELDRQSDRLAAYLQGRFQPRPDELIGIMLGRSERMVVALLGILKAGAAYLPIDPEYPRDRIEYMLADSGFKALVTETGLETALAASASNIVNLDSDAWERETSEVRRSETGPEHLAYVLYTSGSTGAPKGVQIPHRAVVNFLHSMKTSPGIGEEDILLAVTPISFDIAALELLLPLIVGATTVIASRAEASSASLLSEKLTSVGATVMQATPATWRMLTESNWSGSPKLKILSGGEALPSTLAARLSKACASLWNLYGPTETTIWSSTAQIRDVAKEIAIGQPIANTGLYLLDRNLEPTPYGAAGELYIGGDGLARGYLGRPALTAERFLPDPFSSLPGARIYRTGDLGRHLAQGEIEILGRIDHQVKIHGHRIELGEIEFAIDQHPGVEQTVVVAVQAGEGEKRIVAYLVSKSESRPETIALREFVREKLPDYMIPTAFLFVDSFPLTPNGKIDKKALPAPDWTRAARESAFVAPKSFVEETLAAVWSHVLGVEALGVDDNFFALGGDSMRAIRIAALAEEKGFRFTINELFERQTIRKLTEAIETSNPDLAAGAAITAPFCMLSETDRLLTPEDAEDAFPLTMLQAGMVFEQELNPETATYHQIISFHLQVPFSEPALKKAMDALVARHPALRATIHLSRYSEPMQVVHRRSGPIDRWIEVEDLRAYTAEEQQKRIADWIETERKSRVDWEHAPLARFRAHRRTDDSLQFSLTAPHALLDGWSDGALLTELFNRYTLALDDQSIDEEPPLTSAFRDYVAAERRALHSEESRKFWDEQLRDLTVAGAPRLGSAHARNAERRFATLPVPISAELAERLNALARGLSVPLKSVLLAAHLRVLSLLAGRPDVVTGLVTNTRLEHADSDQVMGLFLNTLPLRMRLKGGAWKELIREIFEAEKGMLPHRRFPMFELQRRVGEGGLFEIGFNFTHFHVYENMRGREDVRMLGGGGVVETDFVLLAAFDLDIGSKQARLHLHGDTAALGAKQLESIAEYYARALDLMARDPESPYHSAEIQPPAETRRLIEEWNRTYVDYDRERSVDAYFREQVAQGPERIAITSGSRRMTYGELDAASNRLARWLIARGVGPETQVGVCLRRSPELIVGLLGILKAGGAYTPLDASYPVERLALMVEDAGMKLILTEESLKGQLLAQGPEPGPEQRVEVAILERLREELEGESDGPVESRATGGNLAYVIYTSGSTGRSKGVCIEHRAVARLVKGANYAELGPEEVILQFAPVSFDAATFEIWGALCNGGRLALAPAETISLDELAEEVERQGVTTMWLTSALFQQMVEGNVGKLSGVRQLLAGGDTLPVAQVRKALSALPQTRLINGYGPTENTTFTTTGEVDRSDPPEHRVPIGRPISNTQTYILDENQRLVPVGVIGELYTGGEGLGRGYLNRPDLTAERFVPKPFGEKAGERLYRTGDQCRYLEDGRIEFVGRNDHQIKLRGYRIELGEIESALTSHPEVREAVVEARPDRNGEKRLVAYLIRGGKQFTQEELRAYLSKKLPEYMTPTAYVELTEFPVTPNGKIDRRKLPNPELMEHETRYVEPGSELEFSLATIWAESLGVERVGVETNFFALGGHSLSAMRLISRVRDLVGIDVSLRSLYANPTIRSLAAFLEQTRPAQPTEMETIAALLESINQMTLDEARLLLERSSL